MNFKTLIGKFVTCEVTLNGKVSYFAKLSHGQWTNVNADGTLDWVEISPADFESTLEVFKDLGANIRFTNHSAA